MKIFAVFCFLFFLVSCQNKEVENNISKNEKQKPQFSSDSSKNFLSEKELNYFVKNSKTFDVHETLDAPFDSITFNKVVAYEYDGAAKSYASIFDSKGRFIDIVEKQKLLSKQQTIELINQLTDEKTYGGGTAACFNPHLGIVFYDSINPVFHLDVCLDCNYLISSKEIPSQVSKKVFDDEGQEIYPLFGFSELGKKYFIKFGKELDFYYGRKKFE